ncbi:lipid transferase CIDEC-like isoform X2 [Phyllopteryx taeniolatus]|uniref:lipid transferase CIDEC-like isoform X2 n=1 Tax=Phyllopteryx taeniolatus TaxID=161469 RepID=UPI002AD475B9|nr:lipid transferase CIDEC-like isoform X2 [Phyllopteryx taeniolatus]
MDYARKSLDLLTLSSFSKCVTASMSASASMTQQLLSRRPPRPKPFRVTNADRSLKKGIMADALEDLINKNSPSRDELFKRRAQHRTDVAKLTFDLYKNNPSDFIGCLNVKATLYGVYSLSYEVRCYEAKKMLKEALRWTVFSMQATGHILLGSSWYMEQLLEEERGEEGAEESLILHRESRIGCVWQSGAWSSRRNWQQVQRSLPCTPNCSLAASVLSAGVRARGNEYY